MAPRSTASAGAAPPHPPKAWSASGASDLIAALTRCLVTRLPIPIILWVLLTGCQDPYQARDGGLPGGSLQITRAGEMLLELDIELALTASDQAQGLMGVESIPDDYGMVFLFSTPIRAGFIMKQTLIPLDIAFWNEDGEIIDILQMVPCTEDPCESYVPGSEFVGAVEVNRGLMDENGVKEGDKVALTQG